MTNQTAGIPMSAPVTSMKPPHPAHTCAVCGTESNIYKCFSCGRRACENDYNKRHALCRTCAEAKGIEVHRNSIMHPIFH